MKLPKQNFRYPPRPKLQHSGFSQSGGGGGGVSAFTPDLSSGITDNGIYTSVTSGSTITFSGNGLSNNYRTAGMIYFDTGVPFVADSNRAYQLAFNLLFSFLPVSGTDDLNLGIFCFTDNPKTSADTDGAGWWGGGTIDRTGQPANSCVMRQVGLKRSSVVPDFISGGSLQVTSSIRRMCLSGNFQYRKWNQSTTSTTLLPDNTGRGNMCFGENLTTWFDTSPSNSNPALAPTGTGGNIFIGIWLGRNVGTAVPTATLSNCELKFLACRY